MSSTEDIKHSNIIIDFRPEENRSVALDGEVMAGECTFLEEEDRWIIDHTRVQPAYGGQGIAQKLVEEVLSQAKARGKKIEAQCSYAYKVIQEEEPQILVGEEANSCRIG